MITSCEGQQLLRQFRGWGEFLEKKGIPQRGGRRVTASAVEGGLDANAITSNAFELEWPLKSGRTRPFQRSTVLPGSICRPHT